MKPKTAARLVRTKKTARSGAAAVPSSDWKTIVTRLKDVIERELDYFTEVAGSGRAIGKNRKDDLKHLEMLVRAVERVRIIHEETSALKSTGTKPARDPKPLRAELERRLARLAGEEDAAEVSQKPKRS